MRLALLMVSALLLTHCVHQKFTIINEITTEELYEHVAFLASDSLKGRKPGTPQEKVAAEYIRDQVIKAGLKPLAEHGFQYFNVVTAVEAGPLTKLSFDGYKGKVKEDFIPLAYSENGSHTAEVVFVDYGFDFETDSLSWHSYTNVDVTGKFVLVLRGDPDPERTQSIFESYNSLRNKTITAKDKGALGIIFVSGAKIDEQDELLELSINQGTTPAGIQVIHIKRPIADLLLKDKNVTIDLLEKDINETRKPRNFALGKEISLTTEVIKNEVTTQNVVALLKGNDPMLKDEYIVLGAHYDHLGFGGVGSGSRRPDTLAIHNGADDNASGVASILEIIEKIAAHRDQLKRSILFMAFGAEEMGLIGSKEFTNNPLIDLKQIKYMLNLDMVGSLNSETKALTLGGTGTALGLSDLVNQVADTTLLKIKQSSEGYGPSDHASFYIKDIPVLFFFTGVNEDYHTPDDDAEKLNYAGQKVISDYVYDLISELDQRPEVLAFQEAGPKMIETGGRRGLKVTLGIMPDFASQNTKGLRADVVIKNRPADLAGMKSGDVIIALDGKQVNDIYEYMARLKEFKKGQRISVDVMRGNEKMIFIVEL